MDLSIRNRYDVFAVVFVIAFGAFMALTFSKNLTSLIDAMENPQSNLDYKEARKGIHDPSLIAFRGFEHNGDPVNLTTYCECRYRRTRDASFERPCLSISFVIKTSMVGFGNKTNRNYNEHFYEVPINWELGEHLKLTCDHPDLKNFIIATSPFGAPFSRLMEAFGFGMEYVQNFYAKYFEIRPLYLNPSGYYNNILLSKKIFLSVGEKDFNETNTYMTLVSSRTESYSENHTEFTVGWPSDRFLIVKSVKVAEAFDVVSFIAGPLLLSERMFTLFFKIKQKGQRIDRKASQRSGSAASTPSGPPIRDVKI